MTNIDCESTMDSLTTQIRDLYARADNQGRQLIQERLRDLQYSLDTEWDLAVRIMSGSLHVALVKIGSDLKLFSMLADEAQSSLSIQDLATKTSAAPKLLARLLRTMASFGLIAQRSPTTYAANRITYILASVHVAGALDHVYDVHVPVAHVLPRWLAERSYKEIVSNEDLPFQAALNTRLKPFEWMKEHPEQMKSLGHAMAIQREGSWTETYDVVKEVGDFDGGRDSALLVDIGGGFGQQALAFKKAFPGLEGRIVVQDLSETLDRAPKVDDVEYRVHDFFERQPIKEAKFYYLRHILHDFDDQDCVRIVKAVVSAMGSKSRIVIDEVILPDEKLPWQAGYMDLTMMAALGGVERTRCEFNDLLEAAGLEVLDVHIYDAKLQGVIVAALKQRGS